MPPAPLPKGITPGQIAGNLAYQGARQVAANTGRYIAAPVKAAGAVTNAAAGAALGAGVAVTKRAATTLFDLIPLFVIIASKWADYVLTGGKFGLNPATLIIDFIILFYVFNEYYDQGMDYLVFMWIFATAAMGTIMNFLNVHMYRLLGDIAPTLMVILFVGVLVGVAFTKKSGLGIILAIFWLELSLPYFNEIYNEAWTLMGWPIFLVIFPWWGALVAHHEARRRKEQNTPGINWPMLIFLGMVVALVFATQVLQADVWQNVYTEGAVNDEQLEHAQGTMKRMWKSMTGYFTDMFDEVKCGIEVVNGNQECTYEKANKHLDTQVDNEDKLEIQMKPDKTTRPQITADDTEIVYNLELTVTNKLLDEVRIKLVCGVSDKDSNIPREDEIGVITGIPNVAGPGIIVVRKTDDEEFTRNIQCRIPPCNHDQCPNPGRIDPTKGILFFRAYADNLKGTVDYGRFFVEERIHDDAHYEEVTDSDKRWKGTGANKHASYPSKGFAHMVLKTDRDVSGKKFPGIIFAKRYNQIDGSWTDDNIFRLDPSIKNDDGGVITLNSLVLELGQQMSVDSACPNVETNGNKLIYDVLEIPADEVKQGQTLQLQSCNIKYDIDQNLVNDYSGTKRTEPQWREISGMMTYNYKVTETFKLSIGKSPTKQNENEEKGVLAVS